MIAALIREISLSSLFLLNDRSETEIIETIYFGGGTPSLFTNNDIKNLLDAIRNNYSISDEA